MSLVIMFYFTSSMLNMFRTLTHPSSGSCDFSIVSPLWSCVLVSMCVWVSVWLGWLKHNKLCFSLLHGYHHTGCVFLFWCVFEFRCGWFGAEAQLVMLQPATRIPPQPSHTETPTHIETRTHDQCGDTIEKSHVHDDGRVNVRNILSIEEVK